MVWAVSLFSVTWLWSRPDTSPWTFLWGHGIPQPAQAAPSRCGQGATRWLGVGTQVSPGEDMEVLGEP